jgi:teichuronic acid biosynthesis glycosyltransferase TuaG
MHLRSLHRSLRRGTWLRAASRFANRAPSAAGSVFVDRDGQDAGSGRHRGRDFSEVSVICTARNAAATVGATIDSILAQDMPNWEMIIVDDGSTDDTIAVVSRYAGADARIKLVRTGGIGRGRALNRALAEAYASLIANIDADDVSHPHRLRCQVEAIKQQPQFAVICTEFIRVYGADSPLWPTVNASDPAPVKDVTKALALSNPVCHSSVIMRKPAIIGVGGYNEGRRFVFDYDLWVRCAAAGLRIGKLQMPLTAKRIHSTQYYLHTARLPYMLASLQVQIRGMRTLGVKTWQLPVVALRATWLILPLSIRETIGKITNRLRTGEPWSS